MAFMPKDISINVQEVLKRIPKDELKNYNSDKKPSCKENTGVVVNFIYDKRHFKLN